MILELYFAAGLECLEVGMQCNQVRSLPNDTACCMVSLSVLVQRTMMPAT